jgi:hypothetical protein
MKEYFDFCNNKKSTSKQKADIKCYDTFVDKNGLLWTVIGDWGFREVGDQITIANREYGCCIETYEDFVENYTRIENINIETLRKLCK